MPSYSYRCEKCQETIEIFCSIGAYKDQIKCKHCKKLISRDYNTDMATINSTIKKSDCELKTIGDLAQRNNDKMSDDEKVHLHQKHNAYKDKKDQTELPKGMTRMKKQQKVKWY
jgi:putative FmdB family regulatory protein